MHVIVYSRSIGSDDHGGDADAENLEAVMDKLYAVGWRSLGRSRQLV